MSQRFLPPWSILCRKEFRDLWGIFGIWGQILRFFVKITWFLSFSGKNDAESLCHFVKIPFLDLKRAKLDKKSDFSHVRTLSWLHKLRNTQGKIPPCTWNISRKHISKAAAPLGRRRRRRLCFWWFSLIDIYGYSLYSPDIFHICFLDMFHVQGVFSLVCFLIYGVKRR